MPTTEATRYELSNRAAWITLARPGSRNALSAELDIELHDHLAAANADPDVRVIVLTGAGSAFCAGADLKSPPGEVIVGGRALPYADLLAAILESPKPVIAAVNGAAFAGGIGLVAAADIAITANEALFSFSEVRIGVIPAVISVVCLPKLGAHHGMKLFLTGERFDGRRAVEVGLVHHAVPADELVAAVQEQVDMIALGGPTAVIECKRLVRRIPQLGMTEGFAEATGWSARMFRSDEAAEGMAAFREKRSPTWMVDPPSPARR
jgi:methylglutaconyl-CoA hydratase